MRFSPEKFFSFIFASIVFSGFAFAQSGHSLKTTSTLDGSILSVTAWRTGEKKDEPIKTENLYLYENGIEQKIKNFSFDPSPAKIAILVDNSQTLRADVEKMNKAVMEFAYEIFDGDQLFVLAFDEKPEIIQEWTDDAKKIEKSLATFRKQGNPYIFDAVDATVDQVLLPLMPGTRKTAVVIISDGLDRGSKTDFQKMLDKLQNENIVVYALQIPDRTGGAYRRNQPKANKVIKDITEGTGGKVFQLDEAQEAAKFICDELRKNRYLLSYFPTNNSSYEARRVFVGADTGIEIRTKTFQPPNIK